VNEDGGGRAAARFSHAAYDLSLVTSVSCQGALINKWPITNNQVQVFKIGQTNILIQQNLQLKSSTSIIR